MQHAYTVEGVMKWYAKELGFAEDKLAEKWFGKDATTEIVEEGIKKYTAIKLLFVSYNLGSVLPIFSDFIRKTFNFKTN